jgi:hypothetical protein
MSVDGTKSVVVTSPRNSIVDESNSWRPEVNITVAGIAEFQGNKKWIIYMTYIALRDAD